MGGNEGLEMLQCRWSTVLRTVSSEALDCIQTSFAVIVTDLLGGAVHHHRLGETLRFPEVGPHKRLGFGRSLDVQLDEIARQLGLECNPIRIPASCPGGTMTWSSHAHLVVVADAHDLPWLPYYRRAHMPHGFFVQPTDEAAVVVDAYHNDTEWGPARPGVWSITLEDLDTCMAAGGTVIEVWAPQPARSLPPTSDEGRGPDLDRSREAVGHYVAEVRNELSGAGVTDLMVLDIWQATRNRRLHQLWLGESGGADAMAVRVAAWERLATQSYVALRRQRRAAPAGGAIVEELERLLHDDLELVQREPGPSGPRRTRPVRDQVVTTVGDVLGLDEAAVRAARTFRDLPGFDSFRLVEAIASLEAQLGVEAPAELVGHDLLTVDGLTLAFDMALHLRSEPAGA